MKKEVDKYFEQMGDEGNPDSLQDFLVLFFLHSLEEEGDEPFRGILTNTIWYYLNKKIEPCKVIIEGSEDISVSPIIGKHEKIKNYNPIIIFSFLYIGKYYSMYTNNGYTYLEVSNYLTLDVQIARMKTMDVVESC